MTRSPFHHHRGASLIEVLVAILVVSVGILSMIAMQANATKLTKTSEHRAMAALLVADLADRMRANRPGFDANQYSLVTAYPSSGTVTPPTKLETCNTPSAECSANDLAAKDMNDWQRTVAFSLPGGLGRVTTRDANGGVDVWLAWVDPNDRGENNANNDARSATECPTNFVAAPGNQAATAATPHCMYFRVNL